MSAFDDLPHKEQIIEELSYCLYEGVRYSNVLHIRVPNVPLWKSPIYLQEIFRKAANIIAEEYESAIGGDK